MIIHRSLAATAAFAVFALQLGGCATAPSNVDPLEPFNRAMYSVHEVVDGHVIKPIAEGYVKVTPRPIRTGVSNVFGNLDDLFSGINNLLQGNPARAGDDFGRVLLNSTIGFAGIFDIASDAGIQKDEQDFGITFGKWGVPNGPYLFVPLFGPTTFRDGAGWIVRIFSSPVGYMDNVALRNSITGVNYLDARARALDAESVLDTASLDRYRFLRGAYLKSRRYKVYDGKPPPDDED